MQMTIFEMKNTQKGISGRLYIEEKIFSDHECIRIETVEMKHIGKANMPSEMQGKLKQPIDVISERRQ